MFVIEHDLFDRLKQNQRLDNLFPEYNEIGALQLIKLLCAQTPW